MGRDREWMVRGRCRDPLLAARMFPTDTNGVDAAKAVCSQCAVREPCLEYALGTRQRDGVWGGASEKERRRMIRQGA